MIVRVIKKFSIYDYFAIYYKVMSNKSFRVRPF